MAVKQSEGTGHSKVVMPEQHDAARREAKRRQRTNRAKRVEPLFGEDTRVRDLTLADRKKRAERRHAREYESIREIEELLRSGAITDARKPQVLAKLADLKEKVGAARF